jgi:cobalt-zinc-cadmium efflux system protein
LIIISALVIKKTGFMAIDPILGIAFGVVLLIAAYVIIRQSFTILMEAVPAGLDVGRLVDALRKLDDVKDVHHLHAWVLTSNRNVFSAHLKVGSMSSAQRVLKEAYRVLRDQYGFHFSTLQIETSCLDEIGAEDIDPQSNSGNIDSRA